MEVPIGDIKVGTRFRQDYGDLERLAESIKRYGLIQPLAVDAAYNLLAGGRRYAGALLVGLEKVPVRVIEQLDELTKREIELEENIERKDLSWQEEVSLKKEIDELKRAKFGSFEDNRATGWSSAKTAELLGESPANLSRDLELAKATEFFPELSQEKTKQDAQRKLRQIKETLVLRELEKRQPDKLPGQWKWAKDHYMIGDTMAGLEKMRPGTAHLIECDPPYGIDIDEILRTADISNREDFVEATPEDFPTFMNKLCELLFKIATDDAYLLMWFAWINQQKTHDSLTNAGWLVDPIPGIWVKNAPGKPADANVRLMVRYEQFYLARKGLPTLAKPSTNVFIHDSVPVHDRICLTEKPTSLYDDLLDLFYRPRMRVVCPFLGSGSFMLACYKRDLLCYGWDLSERSKELFLQRVWREFGDI
jgi:ParB/RepB/Spo0J family partition protein